MTRIINTKPDISPLRFFFHQLGYVLSPGCERMLARLTEDVVVNVYEAYCATAAPPMPDDADDEGWAEYIICERERLRINAPALRALSNIELNLALSVALAAADGDYRKH